MCMEEGRFRYYSELIMEGGVGGFMGANIVEG